MPTELRRGDLRDRRLLTLAGTVLVVTLMAAGCSTGAGSSSASTAAGGSAAATSSAGPPPSRTSPTSPSTSASSGPPTHLTVHVSGARLPTALADPVVLTRGKDVVVVGGLTSADTTTNAVWLVDPATGTVSSAGRLPEGVHDAAGAVLGGRAIVFGGGASTVSSSVQDVTLGHTPRVIGRLPRPRADLVATTVGGAAYLLGGYDGSAGLDTVLRTTDGRTFTAVAHLPVTVRYPALAAADGSLWVFGGEHAGAQTSAVQRVDLAAGTASVVGHLPRRLAHAGAFTLDGGIYLAGGRRGTTATRDVLRFTPSTRTFARAGTLPVPASDFGIATSGGAVYLVGGKAATGTRTLQTIVEVGPRGDP